MKHLKRFILYALLPVAVFTACKKSGGTPEPVKTDQTTPPKPEPPQPVVIAQVDAAVSEFMTRYSVPAVSVAITKEGKLVYAKAYGQADKEAGTAAAATSLFRIASVSKPVTSIAVMKLIEDGKLSMDAKVFGPGALLDTRYGTKTYSDRLKSITVRHLLQHTAGGWGNSRNDPMFSNPTFSADQLISWTLDNYTLDYAPGTRYDYSNFGYCLLGRIIEKVSGVSYENYVQNTVLKPAGITTMQIGGNTLADRKPNEVKYYGTAAGGSDPYIYNVARMDAHGGWIASATDLVRLAVRVDGFANKPDMLKPETISLMTTAPALNVPSGYACGWSVNTAGNWWHMGGIPGTATELVRTSGGFCWAILTNTRGNNAYNSDLDSLIWKAVNDSATVWPTTDLF
ncbi:MAG: beta-lactamase family protein [Mucilaginibacter polytrichastri]|nr:beta-lactamase family protein [Mucilaginibacter polytrichastri]